LRNFQTISRRLWLTYGIWIVFCCLIFWKPLAELVRYSLNNDNASHIVLIPLIVAWLLYNDRALISKVCAFDLLAALPVVILAALLGALSLWRLPAGTPDSTSLLTLSLILFLCAGFIAIFGRASAKATWFSLAFLGFAIPLPETFLDRFIYALQYASASVAGWIFDTSGIPVLREGLIFHLSGLNIEVARECSGIRSSIALLILATLVAHFAFAKLWKKLVFLFAGLAMMAVKNGVRIATLTILAKYVDPDFLFGRLHHQGGVVFFLLGLALLIPVYWLLRRGEKQSPMLMSPATSQVSQ
jgi:exosortase